MNKPVVIILVIFLCFGSYYSFNWWLRLRFIVDGYTIAGSYKKKHKEYQKRWSLPKQIALLPLFCPESTIKYHFLGVINYCHFLISVFTICGLFLHELIGRNMICWQYGMVGICIACVFQIILICLPVKN